MHARTIEPVKLGKVELLQHIGGAELRAPQARAELIVFAPRGLSGDEHGGKLGAGKIAPDRRAVRSTRFSSWSPRQ